MAHSTRFLNPPPPQAHKFADKCFTPLEVYSFKHVFKVLADCEQELRYLKEDTVTRFLEIPDILHASPIVFQIISYLGAFPVLREAPAVLGLEQMLVVVTLMTERYRRVLAKGAAARRNLLFKSLAVYDRSMSENSHEEIRDKTAGSKVDNAGSKMEEEEEENVDDGGGDDDDDDLVIETDELVLAAFESIDYVDAFKQGDAPAAHGAMIPADNFRKLLMLLLLIAPLGPQESLSTYSSRFVGNATELAALRTAAESILASFLNVEKSPGIRFHAFNTVIPACLPHVFDGFNALFEHFLFSRDLDLGKHTDGGATGPAAAQPLLQDQGSIMNLSLLSQLAFFLPGSALFRRLRLLYSGEVDGFSMGSFESKVFNWRAPTVLLVRGTRLRPDAATHGSRGPASSFAATLPPKRFPDSSRSGRATRGAVADTAGDNAAAVDEENGERLCFGVYVSQPWRHTSRECFGDDETRLFQLEPVHDVLAASALNRDYVAFAKGGCTGTLSGLAFGCPPPSASRHASVALGPVSLYIDGSFEFGCFTHDRGGDGVGGGAFRSSAVRRFDFQDRFAVEGLEVWGCGGGEEARHQAERWAWEAREAEARRRVNLGTGDVDADRALLEMAGLVGGNRSGGSMA